MSVTQSEPHPSLPSCAPHALWQRMHDDALEATYLPPELCAVVRSYLPKSPHFEELLAMTVLDQFLDFVPKRVTDGGRVYGFEWSRETHVPAHVLLCAAGIAFACEDSPLHMVTSPGTGGGGRGSCSRMQRADFLPQFEDAIDMSLWLSAKDSAPEFVKSTRTTPIVNALADVAAAAEIDAGADEIEIPSGSPTLNAMAIMQTVTNGWFVYHSQKSGYWIIARGSVAAALHTQTPFVPCRALRFKWSSYDENPP